MTRRMAGIVGRLASGGQFSAQGPLQVDLPPASLSKVQRVMPLASTKVLPFGVSAVFSIRADALDIAAPLPMKHEDAGCVAWTNAAEYDSFHLIVIGIENCVAPIDFLEALVCRLFTT